MQGLQELKTAYQDRAKQTGSIFLLNAFDALDYIETGVRSGFSLLGVEGFRIMKEGAVQPTQDFSNDIADCSAPAAFREKTEALIRRGAIESIWFEVVFQEPNQSSQS